MKRRNDFILENSLLFNKITQFFFVLFVWFFIKTVYFVYLAGFNL